MTQKLRFVTKLFYGIGDMGAAAVVGVGGFFLNPFLLDVAGLTPALVGVIFLVSGIWDSINDPLLGQINDRTRSRFGRRKSWMLFASVPLGVTFFLIWLVPDVGMWGKFAYFLLMVILLDTFYTMHHVPYATLTAEMTDDYNERTELNMYRFGFSLIGALLAIIIFGVLVTESASPTAAYRTAAMIVSVFIIITAFAPIPFSHERTPELEPPDARPSWVENAKSVFSNRPFRLVTLLFLCSWMSVQTAQSNIVLYLRYWLKEEGDFTFAVILLQLSAVSFIIFYSWLSKRIGKKRVYYIGGAIWAAVFCAVFFLQPGQDTLFISLLLIGGGGTAIAVLIPFSMLPDVIDYDELQTGTRREGLFYGYFAFFTKLGFGLGLAVTSFILEAVGYIPSEGDLSVVQPESVLLTIRIFVSFLPATIVMLSMIPAYQYPITEEVHRDILRQLGRVPNQEESATAIAAGAMTGGE